MSVTVKGATDIITRNVERYTPAQKMINALVNMAPGILGSFRQQPTLTIEKTYERNGVPLSRREIAKIEAKSKARELAYPYPTDRERAYMAGGTSIVTMAITPEGFKEIGRRPYDPGENPGQIREQYLRPEHRRAVQSRLTTAQDIQPPTIAEQMPWSSPDLKTGLGNCGSGSNSCCSSCSASFGLCASGKNLFGGTMQRVVRKMRNSFRRDY